MGSGNLKLYNRASTGVSHNGELHEIVKRCLHLNLREEDASSREELHSCRSHTAFMNFLGPQ